MSDLNSEVLALARESRGRTQEEVASSAGVSQGLLSKAERGLASLPDDAVRRIAADLEYPVRLFYVSGRVREVGSPCLYHRKRKTLPAKILNKLDATMYLRLLNVQALLDGLDVEGDRTFHTLDVDEYGSPAEVARALRAAWRIPNGPIKNMTTLIESAGGIVVLDDFGHRKLFGMSCWTVRRHPLFFLNSQAPTHDLRWTLAHELGHLTMHAGPPEGDPEEEAEEFAGEFLAPTSLFKRDVRGLTFDKLPVLKTYWGLSMKGVIKRALAIRAIDQRQGVRLYKQHSARGYNTAEPYPLPSEKPSLVDQAITIHLREHDYTHDQLAESVGLLPGEFAKKFMGDDAWGSNVISLFGTSATSSA